jgi:hypothetical protein
MCYNFITLEIRKSAPLWACPGRDKMKSFIATTVALLAVASSLFADGALVRQNGREGGASSTTLGYFSDWDGLEFWGFGIDGPAPSYETGKLWPVKADGFCLLLGGYFAWWPEQKQVFAEPFGVFEKEIGEIRFSTCQGIYLPLNGGPICWFSGDTSAQVEVAKNLELGLGSHWWEQDGDIDFHFGPKVSVQVDKINITARYCPWGNSTPATWQLQATTSF